MYKHLDVFTRQYIETALWSSTDNTDDDGGEPLDANYRIKDIEQSTLKQMIDDCRKFQTDHADLIINNLSGAGHDFWLTRNGHGAGFWDGDWPEPAATMLTKSSHTWGEVNLYIDKGKVCAE